MLNWLEINLDKLSDNVKKLRQFLEEEVKIMAVVKANGYGHGLVEVARTVWVAGGDSLAVAELEEAVKLREAKIKAPILVMGYTPKEGFSEAIDFGISLTLWDYESAGALSFKAEKLRRPGKFHFKVDTGMHRLGARPEEAADILEKILRLPGLAFEGIYSHFAEAGNLAFSGEQLKSFKAVLFGLQRRGLTIPLSHIANSEGTLNFPESHLDMVRSGLIIYGLINHQIGVNPVLKFKTIIGQIKRVPQGETIGYKRTFKAERPMRIAILPVGYSDGYPRSLSNKAEVLVRGKRAKVVGLICMNQTIIDVTGISCRVDDEVTLIGEDGDDKISVDDVARWAGTNAHEIVSRLPADLERKFIKDG